MNTAPTTNRRAPQTQQPEAETFAISAARLLALPADERLRELSRLIRFLRRANREAMAARFELREIKSKFVAYVNAAEGRSPDELRDLLAARARR